MKQNTLQKIITTGLLTASLFGCNGNHTAVTTPTPRTHHETEQVALDEQFHIGRAPYSAAVEWFNATDISGSYELSFERNGTGISQILTTPRPDGRYEGTLVANGDPFRIIYDPATNTIQADRNADGIIEPRDTLAALMSRDEPTLVMPGQHFTINDGFDERTVEFVGYDLTQRYAQFVDQATYSTIDVPLSFTPAGLGGTLVTGGQPYDFGFSEDGIIIDRNGDGQLDGLLPGFPPHPYAAGYTFKEGYPKTIVLGPTQHLVEPMLIDPLGDNGRGSVYLRVDQEVTPELVAGQQYDLLTGGRVVVHEVFPQDNQHSYAEVHFALHKD